MDNYIKPVKSYADEDGTWRIEFIEKYLNK